MYYSNSQRVMNWRIDDDGLLRVTGRVLAEGVFPYWLEESPGMEAAALPDGQIPQYIPRAEFTRDALQSLEGKPVIVDDHVWRTPENAQRDGLTVGSIAGTPRVDGKYLVADMVITDADAIDAVKRGELVELSAGYNADCSIDRGTHSGKQYTASQHNLHFNHVLLLPKGKGRCGPDVRIVNSKRENIAMADKNVVVRVQLGNKAKQYRFTNEDDAREAEEMVEETKKFNADELQAAVAAAEELKAQMDELKAQYDQNMQIVAEQKAQIDELMSAEAQDAMADEALAQQESEDAIIDELANEACDGDRKGNEVIAETEEKTKEELKNRIRNSCKTYAERRRVLVQNAFLARGAATAEDFAAWDQTAYDGAFEALALSARVNNAKRQTPARVSMAATVANMSPQPTAGKSPLSRILNSARAKRGNK